MLAIMAPAPLPPDPDLAPHLHPGEEILWQDRPALDGLFPPAERSRRLLWESMISLLCFGAALFVASRPAERFFLVALGIACLVDFAVRYVRARWRAEGALYAITSQRLLVVGGGRLELADTPEAVQAVEVLDRSPGYGDVLWRRGLTTTTMIPGRSQPDAVGFRSVADPGAVAERLRAWVKERALPRLDRTLADLAAAARGEPIGGRLTRIGGPDMGCTIVAPADWPAEAMITKLLSESVVRMNEPRGTWAPLAEARPGWTAFRVIGPARSVLFVERHEGRLYRTLASERDHWGMILRRAMVNLPIVGEEPEVAIGPWRGFALSHAFRDVWFLGMAPVDEMGDILDREIWLDAGTHHYRIRQVAPRDAPAAWEALHAVLATLRPG